MQCYIKFNLDHMVGIRFKLGGGYFIGVHYLYNDVGR